MIYTIFPTLFNSAFIKLLNLSELVLEKIELLGHSTPTEKYPVTQNGAN
jgi:hypothetical protein